MCFDPGNPIRRGKYEILTFQSARALHHILLYFKLLVEMYELILVCNSRVNEDTKIGRVSYNIINCKMTSQSFLLYVLREKKELSGYNCTPNCKHVIKTEPAPS